MPYKEKEVKKKYFSVGEIAKDMDVRASQIRFWESEFEILNPQRKL